MFMFGNACKKKKKKIASTNAAWKTCPRAPMAPSLAPWLTLGVQSMIALTTGTRVICHPWANQRFGRAWLGLEKSMTFRTPNKTPISEKELFLCSSMTLGKTGLLFAEWTATLHWEGSCQTIQSSLDNKPLFTSKPCLDPQERRALWRNWAESRLEVRPEAALRLWKPQHHLKSVKDTDVSLLIPNIPVTRYFKKGRWAQLSKKHLKGRHRDV